MFCAAPLPRWEPGRQRRINPPQKRMWLPAGLTPMLKCPFPPITREKRDTFNATIRNTRCWRPCHRHYAVVDADAGIATPKNQPLVLRKLRGRMTKPRRKRSILVVQVSEQEKALFQETARREGYLQLSAWVRKVLLSHATQTAGQTVKHTPSSN